MAPSEIGDFAPALAIFGVIDVAQDSEQPGSEIGAFNKGAELAPRLDQRLLHEIVGAVEIAAERDGEGAQIGDHRENVGGHLRARHRIGGGGGVLFVLVVDKVFLRDRH